MIQYHKIQSMFKRDPANNHKTFLAGQYSIPEFEYLKDNQWVFTEKVDGTNIRIMFDGELKYNGKSDNAQVHAELIAKLHERFDPQLDKFKADFVPPEGQDIAVCFYGEGYGPGIQKGGGLYRDNKDFVLFDVKIGDWWLQRKDVADIAAQFGLDIVPIIGCGTLSDAVEQTKAGFKSLWGDFQAEGMVIRPVTELHARDGKRIITKLKYRDFQ